MSPIVLVNVSFAQRLVPQNNNRFFDCERFRLNHTKNRRKKFIILKLLRKAKKFNKVRFFDTK